MKRALRLEVEQNEPGTGAVGDADLDRGFTGAGAGLDQQGDAVSLDLPDLIVIEPAVRQRGLRPAGVEEADIVIFSRQVGSRRLHDTPVMVVLQRLVLAEVHQELVHRPHPRDPLLSLAYFAVRRDRRRRGVLRG